MFQTRDDLEEAPLLADHDVTDSQDTVHHDDPNSKRQRTPLPWRQFSILLLLRISESTSAHVIAPFLPQLIREIAINDGKDSRVGYYVGILHSSFYIAEACTALYWSRLSDQVGRKPVILIGLFGLSLSMWCFGLSKTFWNLMVSRCLNAALDGSNGAIKSMVFEITDSTNMARAYGALPITTAVGTTVGSLIGGSLAKPAERFPEIFGNSDFLKEYPYFLPCLVPVAIAMLSWLITYLFLRETPRMSLKQYFFGRKPKDYEPSSGPQSNEALPDDPAAEPTDTDGQLPLRALLTRPVVIATASYASLSLIGVSFSSITPVFYSTPIEMGGLGLDPPAIGTILALFGLPGGILQLMLFAPMHDWLGGKTMFLVTVSLSVPAIGLYPTTNAMARAYGLSTFVWFLVGLQKLLMVFMMFSFEVALMFVGAAAPNRQSIGATNGFVQTVVSLTRIVGPAAVDSAFSLSIEKNIMGGSLAYLIMVFIACSTLCVGRLLPKNMWKE